MAKCGIALKGIHKGEYTVCHAHDMSTCPWHAEGSHTTMSRDEMRKANEAIIKARQGTHRTSLRKHDSSIRSYSDRKTPTSRAMKAIRRSSVVLLTMASLSGLAACGNQPTSAPVDSQSQTSQVQEYYEQSKRTAKDLKDRASNSNTVKGMKEDWRNFKDSDDYKKASDKMKAMMSGLASGEVNPTGGQSGVYADITKDQAMQELSTLRITPKLPPSAVGYNRKEWNQDSGASWAQVQGRSACWNVRDQVIADQGQHVVISPDGCKVKGTMTDPYSGVEDPVSRIQIDHSVPLGYVAVHGGQSWDRSRKQAYANDMTRGHLVAADGHMNMQKGDKGPSEWTPPKDKCGYAKNFADVLYKWQLTTTQADHDAMMTIIQQCAV